MKHIEALPPDQFQPMHEVQKLIEKKPKKTDQDTLRAFADTNEWKIIRGIIERKQESLDKWVKDTAWKSSTLEEFGFKRALADQVIAGLGSIIADVERPKKGKIIQDHTDGND